MAITLVPMTEEQFKDYYTTSLKDYANEHVKAGNWLESEAQQKAEEQFHQLLPEGLQTKQNYLFTLQEDQEGHVGILWIFEDTNNKEKAAFIYDVELKESMRGKGLGKETMKAVDEFSKNKDIKQVRLHVFAHNERAISLYKSMGYETTDYYMAKRIP